MVTMPKVRPPSLIPLHAILQVQQKIWAKNGHTIKLIIMSKEGCEL